MVRYKSPRNFSNALVVALFAASLGACGSTDESGQAAAVAPPPVAEAQPIAPTAPLPVPGPACGVGTYAIAEVCVPGTSFADACTRSFGQNVTVSGASVCRIQLHFNLYSGVGYFFYPTPPPKSLAPTGEIPRLDPTNLSALNPYNTQIRLRAGDQLKMTTSAGWGSLKIEVGKFLKIFTWATATRNCRQVSVDGKQDGQVLINPSNGYPAGLFATEGAHAYPIGESSETRILGDGELKLGFNAPSDLPGLCGTLDVSDLRVLRCQDATYRTYECN